MITDDEGARLAKFVRDAAIEKVKQLIRDEHLINEADVFTVVATAGGVMVIDACRECDCSDQEIIDTFTAHVKTRKRFTTHE
jgi:hypothetical protein